MHDKAVKNRGKNCREPRAPTRSGLCVGFCAGGQIFFCEPWVTTMSTTTRPVIAVPSVAEFRKPRTHDEIFRETIDFANLNPALYELAGVYSRPPAPTPEVEDVPPPPAKKPYPAGLKRANEKKRADAEKRRRDLGYPTTRTPSGRITRARYSSDKERNQSRSVSNKKRAAARKVAKNPSPPQATIAEKNPEPTVTEAEFEALWDAEEVVTSDPEDDAPPPVEAENVVSTVVCETRGRGGLIGGYHGFPRVAIAEKVLEKDDMMIAKQYSYKHKNGSPNTTFSFYAVPVLVVLEIVKARVNHNMFEQIMQNKPRKMYFDVDAYGSEIDNTVLDRAKAIIVKHFGPQPMAISGSSKWDPEKGKYKMSSHIVLCDTKYADHAEMKEALGDFPHIYKDEGFDPCAYASRQNMKLPFQSKAGSDRVQDIIEGDDVRDHFITEFFSPEAKAVKAFGLPELTPDEPSDGKSSGGGGGLSSSTKALLSEIKPLETSDGVPEDFDVHTADAKDVLSLIKHDKGAHRLSHQTRFIVMMWAKLRGAIFEDGLRWLALGRDITPEFVAKVRKEWDREYTVSTATIIALLCKLYPGKSFDKRGDDVFSSYHNVKADVFADYQKGTLEQAFGHELPRFYIPDFSSTHKVDVWNIGMGCGKTEKLLANTRMNKGKRTLIITCRLSLVNDISARCAEGGVACAIYNKFGKNEKEDMKKADTLIINGESLGYLRDAPAYDYVYIDEFESFADTWSSHETHAKVGLRRNWEGFMDVWQKAGKVVLMDAFITRKTKTFLEAMGDSYRVVGSKATPHAREMRFLTSEGVTDNKRVEDVCARVANDIKAGKNILMFYPRSGAFKKTGLPDIETVMKSICDMAGLGAEKAVAYYGDQDGKIKDTLSSTNSTWTGKSLVICNSCVTVGVSFTRLHFDKEYVVVPSFLPSRAIIQFTYRARQLRESLVEVCCLKDYIKPPVDRAVLSGMMEGCTKNGAFGVLEDFAQKEKDMASAEHLQYFATLAGYGVTTLPLDGLNGCPWLKKRILEGAEPFEADDLSLKDLANGVHDETIAQYRKNILGIHATRGQKATMNKYYFAKLFPHGPGTDEEFLQKLFDGDWAKHVRTIHEYMNPGPRTLFPYAQVLKTERRKELEAVALGDLTIDKIATFTKEECELYGKKLGIRLFLGKRQNTHQMANELLKRMYGLPLMRYKKTTRKFEFLEQYSAYLKRILENLAAF